MASMRVDPEQLRTVVVTDCGSTTTKALLFERTPEGWRQTARGEAPTTVEEPVADVTVGARNAFVEVQELSGRPILREGEAREGDGPSPFLITETDAARGIDLYLSTSSAGGGLQMLVTGVVHDITLESAQRAALGAGAIVIESVSADDGREDHERIDRIRHVKPDIVLVTGGTDGGATAHVVEMAEVLVAAAPRPRFGETLKLPVIYAGNVAAADEVRRILGEMAQVVVVANVRPELESENLGPAREAIHEFFLSHVMSHSPGYATLMSWTPVPIQPTPSAVGSIVERYAHDTQQNVLCVDIGGATTDVFSVFRDKAGTAVFNRTVSANLGMSYSIANVLVEAGVENIRRWLPFEISASELRDRLRNKMIRPTSIPQTVEDLWLEQAVCREALRLSLAHHRSLAVQQEGRRDRGIADIFKQSSDRYELVDMMKLDTVIGSGGVLSHAPDRMQGALMMIDGFGLEGITQLCVDSIFMMPHLGVFSSVHPQAAREIFERDCLVHLGASVVPTYGAKHANLAKLADVYIDGALVGNIKPHHVQVIAREIRREVTLHVVPYTSGINVGAGAGVPFERRVQLGECGVILDGRGVRGVEEKRSRATEQMTTAQFQALVYRSVGVGSAGFPAGQEGR